MRHNKKEWSKQDEEKTYTILSLSRTARHKPPTVRSFLTPGMAFVLEPFGANILPEYRHAVRVLSASPQTPDPGFAETRTSDQTVKSLLHRHRSRRYVNYSLHTFRLLTVYGTGTEYSSLATSIGPLRPASRAPGRFPVGSRPTKTAPARGPSVAFAPPGPASRPRSSPRSV